MEINARDFRIGNAVLYPRYTRKGEDKIWFVRDLFLDQDKIGLTDGKIQTKVDFTTIVPIPLTEETLLKYGFEKVDCGNGDYKINIQKGKGFGHSDYVLWVDFGFDNGSNKIIISLVSGESEWLDTKSEFLHQLQNLYFALTGEELKINL